MLPLVHSAMPFTNSRMQGLQISGEAKGMSTSGNEMSDSGINRPGLPIDHC
jgi:hypothetical protein